MIKFEFLLTEFNFLLDYNILRQFFILFISNNSIINDKFDKFLFVILAGAIITGASFSSGHKRPEAGASGAASTARDAGAD